MGRLFDLLQAHVDAQPYEVSWAQVAKSIGVARQTVLNWEHPAKLIDKRHLEAIARVTGVPYQRVLDALLEDIGYLHEEQGAVAARRSSKRGPTGPREQSAD